jgi:hypothetical protein
VMSQKPTAGWNANAYITFDYFSATDFKFAGINVSTNKIEMGYRDATGWHVLAQTPALLKAAVSYNLLLSVNGTTATLSVDGTKAFTYTFGARIIDGVAYGLNKGLVGMGSQDAQGVFDNVAVQVLSPQVTYDNTTDLTKGTAQLNQPAAGTWALGGAGYQGTPASGAVAFTPVQMFGGVSRLTATDWLEVTTTVATSATAGLAFDEYAVDDFKFAVLDVAAQRVSLGHLTARGGWVIDTSVAWKLTAGTQYTLMLTLKGTSASLTVNGAFALSYGYNAGVVDGQFGVLSRQAPASFTSLRIRNNDSAFTAATAAAGVGVSVGSVSVAEGNSGYVDVVVPVTLSAAATGTVTVVVTLVAGSATAGIDYQAWAAPVTLTFTAGQTAKTVVVRVYGDGTVEPNEQVFVQLSSPTGAGAGVMTGTVTIVDDDAKP